MPGRMHDARVFRNSPIFRKLNGNPPLLPPHQHIIGDTAYPLMENLVKPYIDNGHLTRPQVLFNERLSGQRSIIERCFALLKGKLSSMKAKLLCFHNYNIFLGRLRRLKYLDMSLQEKIPDVVAVCCILHNFVLLHGDEAEIMHDEDDDQHVGQPLAEINRNDNAQPNRGPVKRDQIASTLQ